MPPGPGERAALVRRTMRGRLAPGGHAWRLGGPGLARALAGGDPLAVSPDWGDAGAGRLRRGRRRPSTSCREDHTFRADHLGCYGSPPRERPPSTVSPRRYPLRRRPLPRRQLVPRDDMTDDPPAHGVRTMAHSACGGRDHARRGASCAMLRDSGLVGSFCLHHESDSTRASMSI